METLPNSGVCLVEELLIASFIGSGINGNFIRESKQDFSCSTSLLLSEVELMETLIRLDKK